MAEARARSRRAAIGIAALLVSCTVLGLAGTDLVLPAIPGLPRVLGGTLAEAQLVLATFAAGTGLGLLLFGELGARIEHRRMLLAALVLFAVTSAAAAQASSLDALVLIRFFQGVAASCAAVVAPGIVRALFDEKGALRALGALGSIESLAPAIAPIMGVALLEAFDWTASFWVTSIGATVLAVLVAILGRHIPEVSGKPSRLGYWYLLKNSRFQRYALSQGAGLGALLVFVFAMPSVFVAVFGGEISDFIVMQLMGISTFIVAANTSSAIVAKLGGERTILIGSWMVVLACLGLLLYALAGGQQVLMIWILFLPFNAGFGVRGPPGFYRALQSSDGDDARASALVILYIMLMTAAGTAGIAPWISQGLVPPTLVAFVLAVLSLSLLLVLPPLELEEAQ